MTKRRSMRLLGWLLSLAMVVALVTVTPAYAEETEESTEVTTEAETEGSTEETTEEETVTALNDGISVASEEGTEGSSEDVTGETVAETAVAKIGETTYETLAAAFSAAVSGDTITLMANVTVSELIEIKSSQNIILELGSYMITGNMSSRMFAVSGKLTITGENGGKIQNTGSSNAISNGGVLVIESGEISATSAYAVYNTGTLTVNGGTVTGGTSGTGYVLYIAGGTVTINGGTFTSTDTSVGAVRNNGTLVINAGTVGTTNTDIYGVYNAGTVTVNGGTLSGSTAGLINTTSGCKATVNGGTLQGGKRGLYNSTGTADIYGGTFIGSEYGLMTNSPETNVSTVYAGTFKGESRAIIGYLTSTIADGSFVVSGAYDKTECVVAVKVASVTSGSTTKYYATLSEAINAAANGATVTLLAEAVEDVIVTDSKSITLDLNGCKLTNAGGHTITVNLGAELTITDSSEAESGKVDNVTHAKAAIYNNGTVTLNSGEYTRSQENGQSSSDNGGNSFYVILNHGTMTINSGVKVTQGGAYSSMIENGYQNYTSGNSSSGYVEGTNAQYPTLTINGGTFEGGLNTIKNDDGGYLTINDGTFKNAAQNAVMNWNVCVINGGTFSSTGGSVINSGYSVGSDVDTGKLTISGGTFTGISAHYIVYSVNTTGTEISGGTYSVSDEGTVYLTNSEDNYADGCIRTEAETAGAYTVTRLILGASTDSESETTRVEAASISGYGTSTLYVGVSATNIGTYNTSKYPTTSLTFTEAEGEEHSYIFAGWYSLSDEDEETYTACETFPGTAAYAKFVDADVLTVKCVVANVNENMRWRFITSVDSLKYSAVGFVVKQSDDTVELTSKISIYGNSLNVTSVYPNVRVYASDFSVVSKYVASGYYDDSDTVENTSFTVTPYWTTLDGSTVYGEIQAFSYNGTTGLLSVNEEKEGI